jgi:Transposase DDE domain/Transposase domain (DUF772)
MMGRQGEDQAKLFYEFCLEDRVPAEHLLRKIDRFLDLSTLRQGLTSFYSRIGRPSIDPELMIRMLVVGYCSAIRSERRLVGGEGFAVDASLVAADANKQRSFVSTDEVDWRELATTRRSVREYLDRLDEAAWGAASEVVPKFISPSDPAAQWTGAHKGHAFFAYADNYLIDLKAAIIVDVKATRASRRAEVGAAKSMLDRTETCFGLKPQRLSADSAYGSAEILDWLLEEKKIAPHVPVWDKKRAHRRNLQPLRLHLRRCLGHLYLPGRQNPAAVSPRVHATQDRRHERQHKDLPSQTSGLCRVRSQSQMLPGTAAPQGAEKRA